MKECQKLYNKYQSELAKEKHTLNSIVIETDGGNGNDTLKSVNSKPQKRSPGTVIWIKIKNRKKKTWKEYLICLFI